MARHANLNKKNGFGYCQVLFTNPTFLGVLFFGAIDGLLVAGFTAFGPKYLESAFNMDASMAGLIFGIGFYLFHSTFLFSFPKLPLQYGRDFQ